MFNTDPVRTSPLTIVKWYLFFFLNYSFYTSLSFCSDYEAVNIFQSSKCLNTKFLLEEYM